MNLQLSRDLPGPGDVLPPDDSEREAARTKVVEVLTEIVADEFMQDDVRIDEARGFFTAGEDKAIAAAIKAGDDMEVGRLTRLAVRRVVSIEAATEAERRADEMDREDERDFAEMAMEH